MNWWKFADKFPWHDNLVKLFLLVNFIFRTEAFLSNSGQMNLTNGGFYLCLLQWLVVCVPRSQLSGFIKTRLQSPVGRKRNDWLTQCNRIKERKKWLGNTNRISLVESDQQHPTIWPSTRFFPNKFSIQHRIRRNYLHFGSPRPTKREPQAFDFTFLFIDTPGLSCHWAAAAAATRTTNADHVILAPLSVPSFQGIFTASCIL